MRVSPLASPRSKRWEPALPNRNLPGPALSAAVTLWEKAMPSGTVKWFDPRRGYGFIQPDDGSKDVFVHISAVEQSELDQVVEGQKVQYDLEDGRQGKLAAANLRAG